VQRGPRFRLLISMTASCVGYSQCMSTSRSSRHHRQHPTRQPPISLIRLSLSDLTACKNRSMSLHEHLWSSIAQGKAWMYWRVRVGRNTYDKLVYLLSANRTSLLLTVARRRPSYWILTERTDAIARLQVGQRNSRRGRMITLP
jgi:hypothetical protein